MNKKPLTGLIVSIVTGRATVCRALALACILLPAVSWAQAQQTQAPVEQIVVTGTRLPDPNLISTSPIQVVDAREIAISGKNDIGDLLLTLPQAFTNDLGQDLGNKTQMILWNHGTLAVGETAAQCWLSIFFLERACQIQVMASTQGREHLRMAPDEAIKTVAMQQEATRGIGAALAWPGCLRKLDRESPGYDT